MNSDPINIYWVRGYDFIGMRRILNSAKFFISSSQYKFLEILKCYSMALNDVYLRHTLDSVSWYILWFLNMCWSWKKCHFSSLRTVLTCQAEYSLKTGISVGKVSSNSIVQFLNFALKFTNRKFNPTGICDPLTLLLKKKKKKKKFQLLSFSTYFFAISFLSSILAKCVRDESCRGEIPPTSPKVLVLVAQTDFCVYIWRFAINWIRP